MSDGVSDNRGRREAEKERLDQLHAIAQQGIDAFLDADGRVRLLPPPRRRLEIVVPGEPIAQPRGRAVRRGPTVAVVSAPSSHPVWMWRDRIKHEAGLKLANWPLSPFWLSTVILSVLFVTPFTGTPKKKSPNPRRWRQGRPDLDNLLKAVMDALTESGVWLDDNQVVAYGRVAKIKAAHGEQPHTIIRIEEAGDIGEVWAWSSSTKC